MEKRYPAKKRNFSHVEIETLTSQVQSNQLVLFGSLKSGVKGISPNQGRQFVLKSGGDKRSDEKTLQQDGKNIE